MSVHWLKRNPRMERQLRVVVAASYVAPFLLLGAMAVVFFRFSGALPDPALGAIAEQLAGLNRKVLVLALFVVSLPIVIAFIMRPFRHRLGTDGLQLYVKLADGKQLTAAPDRLIYDSWKIAYGGYIFPIRTGNGRLLYESGEVQTHIEPLLERAKRVSGTEMLRYQVTNREVSLMAVLVFTIVALIAFAASGM